jgi:hypothetical protein
MPYYIIKLLLSASIIVVVSEVAKRNNFAASIIHSLPLTSLLAFTWIYLERKDSELIANHSFGTFWFVLPTLPMFLLMPWLIRRGWTFWPSLGTGIALTVILYLVTMRLLKLAGVNL